jgi:hypothetical protein
MEESNHFMPQHRGTLQRFSENRHGGRRGVPHNRYFW